MSEAMPTRSQWDALREIVGRLPARLAYYGSALGAIIIAGSGTEGVASIVGNIGAGLLGTLIVEIAKGKDISEDVIQQRAEEAITKSNIEKLLTERDFWRAYIRLIHKLDAQKAASQEILDELRDGFSNVATAEQLEELKQLMLQSLKQPVLEAPTKVRLFISYARADDAPFVERLYHDLKDEYDIWWDRETMSNRGKTFLQEIRDAIDYADRLLLVAGPSAFTSDYVRNEWQYAYETYKGINIVLRLGDYTDFPIQLSGFDAPDFRHDAVYDERLTTLKRQLSEPVAPIGAHYNVPALPPHFLSRPEALDALRDLVNADVDKPILISAAKRITAVEGMGGIGKSVLATAFAHDRKVRFAFSGGIVWLTAGREAKLYELYRAVGVALGDDLSNYPDETTARQNAQRALANKKCLLVLDDVWELSIGRAFRDLISGTVTRLVITTRNLQINNLLSANEYHLKLIDKSQAVDYLRSWVGDDPKLDEIAAKLGFLFLALKLAGARMKKDNLSAEEYLSIFSRVSHMKIGRHATDRDDSLEVSIALSVDAAFAGIEDDRLLYHTFGIFREDTSIPQQTILQVWKYLRPDKDSFDLLEILNTLVDLALAERHDDRTITLHDLLYSYTCEKLGDRYLQTQKDFLASYGIEKWYELPAEDPYLWSTLSYHLVKSGQQDKLRTLLVEKPDWVFRKFSVTGTYESIVSDIVLCLGSYIHNTPDEIIATAGVLAVRYVVNEIIDDYNQSRLEAMVLIDKYIEKNGKRTQEAVNVARLKPDMSNRFDCLFTIWEILGFDTSCYDELEKIAKEIDDPQMQQQRLSLLGLAVEKSAPQPVYEQLTFFEISTFVYHQQMMSQESGRDCAERNQWNSQEFLADLVALIIEITGTEFDPEIYDSREGYLEDVLDVNSFSIISDLIYNQHLNEAIYLLENRQEFGNFRIYQDELFRLAGLLARRNCRNSVEIYDMAENYQDKTVSRERALYEIAILLVNLKQFDLAFQCASLIQPDLFETRNKILAFIEKKRTGEEIRDRPNLEAWYLPPRINSQALEMVHQGLFVGNDGLFLNIDTQRNVSEYLCQVTTWHMGLENIEHGLSIAVIQEIIHVMAWNDRFWLSVQEILGSPTD